MVLYRKKPIVIEATQWFPGQVVDGVLIHALSDQMGVIETLEGRLEVTSGDWIITGIAGEKYPCKPDIFDATYEKVE